MELLIYLNVYLQKSIYLHLYLCRLNTIKDFASSFPPLICCFKENTLSLTLFKIITVTRPNTLVRVFFMMDEDLQLKEGLGSALILPTNKVGTPLPFSFMPYPICPLFLIAFR